MAASPEDVKALEETIATVSAAWRDLKTQKADPKLVAEEAKKLGDMKKKLALATSKGGDGGKDEAKKARLQLKTPKVGFLHAPCGCMY